MCAPFNRKYIHLISDMMFYLLKYSLSDYSIPVGIFMYASSSGATYRNVVSAYMTWGSYLLIIHISRMMITVDSETTGE